MKEGLEVLWVFGEDNAGEAFPPKKAQMFINNTQVQFKVLLDHQFAGFMSVIDAGTEELPQQFIIDPRNMQLVDVVTGIKEPAWDKVKELLNKPL
jgi:hypothetical protein